MTYQQEILARAIGYVDDELILAAHGPRKKLRRALPVVAVLLFCAAFAVAFPHLREVIDTNSDLLISEDESLPDGSIGVKPEAGPLFEMNRPATLGGTTATLVEVTDTTATLEITKTDDLPVYAILFDRRGDALASTEPDYQNNGVVIRHGTLKLYVDGSEDYVYELPSAPGTYRVTVNFTSIRNGSYPMREQIGLYAYMGEEQMQTTVLFSLEIPEESESDSESESDTQDPAAP